jgi:NhaA family Na+:H+ antiporter
VLPLFAFTATGFALSLDVSSPDSARVLAGVVLGLVVGKPAGVIVAALVAVKAKIAVMPEDTPRRAFLGGALLCGVSDPIALLMADNAFPHGGFAAQAKIGVLIGSIVAAALGAIVLASGASPVTKMRDDDFATQGEAR